MSSNTNWLTESPMKPQNDGYYIEVAFLGAAAVDLYNLGFLYNVITDSNVFDDWKFLFTSPSDWITSIICYPFKIPNEGVMHWLKIGPKDTSTYSPSSNKRVIAYVPDLQDVDKYKLYDMGNILIPTYFNNFMDYTGYTQISVYLPFYGYVDVVPNDVVGKYLFVNLFIDYFTGKGLYYISVGNTSTTAMSNRRILVKKEAQIGYNIPIGGTNMVEATRNMMLGAVKTAATVASLALLPGATSTSTISGENTQTATTVTKQGRKNISPKFTETLNKSYSSTRNVEYNVGTGTIVSTAVAGSIDALSNCFIHMSSDKPNDLLLDMAGPKSVKVVIKRPKPIAITNDYNKLYGKPACYTAQLNTLTGFTTISAIHLEGFSTATKEELRILEQTLLGGIIL